MRDTVFSLDGGGFEHSVPADTFTFLMALTPVFEPSVALWGEPDFGQILFALWCSQTALIPLSYRGGRVSVQHGGYDSVGEPPEALGREAPPAGSVRRIFPEDCSETALRRIRCASAG